MILRSSRMIIPPNTEHLFGLRTAHRNTYPTTSSIWTVYWLGCFLDENSPKSNQLKAKWKNLNYAWIRKPSLKKGQKRQGKGSHFRNLDVWLVHSLDKCPSKRAATQWIYRPCLQYNYISDQCIPGPCLKYPWGKHQWSGPKLNTSDQWVCRPCIQY